MSDISGMNDSMEAALVYIQDSLASMVRSGPGDSGYTPEELPEPPDVAPEDYRAAMDQYLDDAGVPEEERGDIYDQLDEQGDYSADGYRQNLVFVIENHSDTINNHVDNSISIEEGAEVHDIHQANDTNQASATGDGAIAGDEQYGQFQTGDGVQVGDGNSGVVNQGDNSGQQAGWDAEGGDFTTGDGNFDNEGTIENSAVAFGGGSADNQTDQSENWSTNDSYNRENTDNYNDSGNTTDSYNTTDEYTETNTVDANLDVTVEDSFQVNQEGGYGHDDPYEHDEPEYDDVHD